MGRLMEALRVPGYYMRATVGEHSRVEPGKSVAARLLAIRSFEHAVEEHMQRMRIPAVTQLIRGMVRTDRKLESLQYQMDRLENEEDRIEEGRYGGRWGRTQRGQMKKLRKKVNSAEDLYQRLERQQVRSEAALRKHVGLVLRKNPPKGWMRTPRGAWKRVSATGHTVYKKRGMRGAW